MGMALSTEQEMRALAVLERLAKSFEILAERVPVLLSMIAESVDDITKELEGRPSMKGTK
jgi:hypothetical protein